MCLHAFILSVYDILKAEMRRPVEIIVPFEPSEKELAGTDNIHVPARR